ncbi:hypothetical protein [Microlunatus soli]|uniref:Uncharacterized protein n=1 Tax=Microlunatus soli TaxID=630515 RepID=A0A1H1UPX0_9ACTN|nr:hypothetical protein [Microlunatus soli]SDS74256.1 hypothetical protein SAMN04489812_2872 [Microlunatus soli]
MRRTDGRLVRYGAALAFLLAAAVASRLTGLDHAAILLIVGGVVVAGLFLGRGRDDRGDRGGPGGGGGRGERAEGQPIPIRVRADRIRRR